MSQLPPVHSWEPYSEWRGKLSEGFYVWRTGLLGSRPVCALSTDVERLAVLIGLPDGMEVLNPQMGPIV